MNLPVFLLECVCPLSELFVPVHIVLISQCGPDFILPYIIKFLLFFMYLYLNHEGSNILVLHPGPSAGWTLQIVRAD